MIGRGEGQWGKCSQNNGIVPAFHCYLKSAITKLADVEIVANLFLTHDYKLILFPSEFLHISFMSKLKQNF